MSESMEKIKQAVLGWVTPEVYMAVVIVLVGFASFGLGRLSAREGQASQARLIEYSEREETTVAGAKAAGTVEGDKNAVNNHGGRTQDEGGMLVGSRNGSKYHFPWCSGAQRIKEENKVWFASADEARAAGYVPAANCQGLE